MATFVKTTKNLFRTQRKDEHGSAGTRDKSKSGKATHKDRSVEAEPPHSHMDSARVQAMAAASPHPQPRSIQYTPPDRAQELDAVSARLQHEPDHTLVAPLTSLNLIPLGTRDKASEKVEPWVSQLRHNSYEIPEGMTGPYESRPTSCAVSLSPLSSASASGADDQRHPFAFAPGRALPFASLTQALRDHQAQAPKSPKSPINAARPRSEVMSRGQPSSVHQALVAVAAQAAQASQHDFSASPPRKAHEATVNARGDKGMTKEAAAPAVQGPPVPLPPIQQSNAEWQTMSKSKPPTQKSHPNSRHSGSQEARDRDAAHADALARLSGGKKRDSLEAGPPKQKTKRHTYDTHATSTTYPSFGHIYHQDGRPIAPPPTQPQPKPPVPHVSAIHAAAGTTVYGAGFTFGLADIAEGTQEGRTAYVETVPDASFRYRIVLTLQEDAPPRALSRAAPTEQAAADAESDLLTESVLVRKLTLLKAAKAEAAKSLRSSKAAASETGSDGSGRTTKAPPSMVPTTMTQVNNLVDNSSFHDETLCQLLDAARLNLIGDEAKKALMRAARTRVSELRDLKDKYEELDSVGPTTPLVIRKKGKKAKGRAKGDSAPPALPRKRVVSDASDKTAKKTSTPPSLDLNIVPDEPRDSTPEDNPSPATPRWATELLSRLGLLENRLTEVENLRGQQGMHASAAASPSILDEIIMGAGFPLGGMGSFAAYAPQFRNPFAAELSIGGGASIHTIHSNAMPGGAAITPLSPNATGAVSPKNTAQAPPSPAPTVPAEPSPVPNIQPLAYPMPDQGVAPGATVPPGVNWPPMAPAQFPPPQAQAPSSQWTQWDAGQYQPPPPPTIPQQFPPMPPNPMPPSSMPLQQPWGQWDGCAYPPATEMPPMAQVPPQGAMPEHAPSAHQTPSRTPTQPPSLAPSRAATQPSSSGSRQNDSSTTPQGPFINIIPPTATPTAPASRQSQSFSPAAPASPENTSTPPGNAPPTLPAPRETTPIPAPATHNVIQAIFERELPPLPSNVSIHLERARSERGAGSERGSAAPATRTPRPASPTASQRTLRGSSRPTSRVPVPPWCPPDVVPLRPSDVVTVVDPLCPPMPTPTPWEVISQRLYDMAMIWEVESFERALQQISLGQEVEAFALTIFAMMTFKRNLAHRLTASPPLVCDKLLVPPLAAQAINNALHAKRIGEAAQVLNALWTPVSSTSPRVLITLTKHVQRGWLASRYDLATGRLTTYHVAHYGAGLEPQDGSASASEPLARAARGSRLLKALVPRRASLPPSPPPLTSGGFEWWHAIRIAWPDRKIPELLTQSVKPVTTDKHEDDSLRAAVVARNLLLPEHEASLSGLREYVWTETKRLLVKKRQGKLVLRPEDEPEGTLTGDMWSSTQVISVGV